MADRREFFRTLLRPLDKAGEGRGASKAKPTLSIRPPYALSESLFQSRCPECVDHACVGACEESILLIAADGTPILNPTQRGCTFCEACAEACQEGVLDLRKGAQRINAQFFIEADRCLSHRGTICFACKEPCIDDAILFEGMFRPVIDAQRCTGCGFCMGRCPTGAIGYKTLPIPGESKEPDEM